MDNNNNSQKPRKKVTKEVLRRRQLTALAVIALIVLIFIILIANACSDKSGKESKKNSTTTTTTTTTSTTTEIVTEPPTTTTTTAPAPAVDPNLSAMVQLSTREITVEVGESDMPYIYSYPDGSAEANEIWTSSDSNIATVSDLGNITGVNPGECNIILQFDNNPAIEVQIKVTVTGAVAVPETPVDPITPETPADVQPDINTPETQDYQAQPEISNNSADPNSLLQDTQGFQDIQNYVAPEQPADNSTPDDAAIQ